MGQRRKKTKGSQKAKKPSRQAPAQKLTPKKTTRTRVTRVTVAKPKKTEGRRKRNAASHKIKRKPRAPRIISASIASKLAAAAQQRYIASDLQQGLEWTKGRVLTDADWVARQAIAASIFERNQTGGQVTRREAEWFDGYACPSGRVAAHFSRLRWDDQELGGTLKGRLDRAYQEGGDQALDDQAARISTEMRVPLREVYTLFWSG